MTTAKSLWNDLNSSQVPFGSIMDVAGRKTRRCDHGGALATWTAVRVAASQQTVVGGVRAMKKASNWRFCGLYTVRNDQRTHPITKQTHSMTPRAHTEPYTARLGAVRDGASRGCARPPIDGERQPPAFPDSPNMSHGQCTRGS